MPNDRTGVFWPADEIEVEKDIQDILVNATEAEQHGILTVLKLFTLYELKVGDDYWNGRIKKTFQRPDIQRMATCFGYFENNVHAVFYNRINECLHINTDEFYRSYIKDETLAARIKFIDDAVNDPDDLYSLGVFSMVEGAILYSNFAFLKHFQSQGKNKFVNIVSGINFSVRDENIHHEGGAWLYNTLLEECSRLPTESEYYIGPERLEELHRKLYKAADQLRDHEHIIADKIFFKGRIEGITAHQLKNFVDSRIDLCLQNIGLTPQYKPASNPIAEWFYSSINSYVMHDFFAKIGNQYHRNWNEKKFIWEAA